MGSIFKESEMITNTELQNHFDITADSIIEDIQNNKSSIDDAKHILTVKLDTMLKKQDALDEHIGDLYNMVFRLRHDLSNTESSYLDSFKINGPNSENTNDNNPLDKLDNIYSFIFDNSDGKHGTGKFYRLDANVKYEDNAHEDLTEKMLKIMTDPSVHVISLNVIMTEYNSPNNDEYFWDPLKQEYGRPTMNRAYNGFFYDDNVTGYITNPCLINKKPVKVLSLANPKRLDLETMKIITQCEPENAYK